MIGVLTNLDGTISVIHPSKEALSNRTPEDIISAANINSLPLIIIPKESIPSNRYFRNAWTIEGGNVVIDRNKAENIQIGRLRFLRASQLEKLDIEMLRAIETSDLDKKKEIAVKKSILRDMPRTVDLSNIPIEDLHLFKPDYLEGDISSLRTMSPRTGI